MSNKHENSTTKTTTKYCRICALCAKDEKELYRCGINGRHKTERQICHTTNCPQFEATENRIDIITELPYKQRNRKTVTDSGQTELKNTSTFWQRIKEFGRRFEALKHRA